MARRKSKNWKWLRLFNWGVLALVALLAFSWSVATSAQTLEDDKAALTAIFHATGGTGWTNKYHWLSQTVTVDQWFGVTVTNDRVTKLELYGNNLTGSIPAEIGNLTALELLDFNGNNLIGNIPAELENLTVLNALHLGGNQLSGAVPNNLLKLVNLSYLGLAGNELTSLPADFKDMTSLRVLDVWENQLTGNVPSGLGGLPRLTNVDLKSNQLTGPIPKDLTTSTTLLHLNLRNNQLSGLIPAGLGNVTSLLDLRLSENQLTGPIPSDLGNLVNLRILYLSNNRLTGPIPRELGNMRSLLSLRLNNNQLSGKIPAELGNLMNVQVMLFSDNHLLTGEIPGSFTGLGALESLYFTRTQVNCNPLTYDPQNQALSNFLDALGDGLQCWPKTMSKPAYHSVNDALLTHVGSALMRVNLDRISRCIDVATSGQANMDMNAVVGQLMSHAAALDANSEQSWYKMLDGMQLNVTKEADVNTSGPRALSFCAGSDWRELKGDDGKVYWDGELYGVNLGANLRLENELLVGLAVSHDRGDIDWWQSTDEHSGDWRLDLTGLRPYVAWSPGNSEQQLWLTVGYGSGTLETLKWPQMNTRQSAQVVEKSIAVGVSWPLETQFDRDGGFTARIFGEAWLGQFDVNDDEDLISATDVKTRGIRGFLEGKWQHDGGLTSLLRFGLQHDNDVAGTGYIGDLGLHWQNRTGLSASLEGRTVFVDGGDLTEWGASADFAMVPIDRDGPKLGLSVSRGDTADDIATLWEKGLESEVDAFEEKGFTVQTEAAWGWKGSTDGYGVLTPFTTWMQSGNDVQTLNVGVRLKHGDGSRLELKGRHRQNAVGATENGLFLNIALNW